MNLNDYKDTNGNVEVSETLVSDLIDASNENINPTFTMYEHINNAYNSITSPVNGTYSTVSGFSLTIPAGKYLVSFQTGIHMSITTTSGLTLPSVRLYSSAHASAVGFETIGTMLTSTYLNSWTSVFSSFVFETTTQTTLSMQVAPLVIGGTFTVTTLNVRTNFPASSGFIRAIKIP